MKTIMAFILLTALLAQTFSQYMVMLDFEINKKYITKNLCVNRSKPACACHGKCYLKKQLAKSEKEENAPNRNNRIDKNGILFFIEIKKITAYLPECKKAKEYLKKRQSFTFQDMYAAVFHPPQTA